MGVLIGILINYKEIILSEGYTKWLFAVMICKSIIIALHIMHFNTLFQPSSIAVIGASTKEGSVSNDLIRNLQKQGYKGHIYPINPKGEPILGLTTYKSILEVGKPVDLAVVVIPAALVPATMEQIAQADTHACIIISAGFKEAGPEGYALEEQVKQICLAKDITLIGPNCLGVINPQYFLNISFAKVTAKPGNVAFISQSGALCSSVLDYAEEYGIGFSKFASVGNKACLDEVALLDYLAQDEDTKVILMYIESMTNVDRFISHVREITYGLRKPIIALKAGRTTFGASASASHTGALAGNDDAYEALFKQAGIIRVDTVEELFVYAAAFAHNGPLLGNRIAIVSNAGGPGVLVTDELVSEGLTLAKFTPETTAILQANLPKAAITHNPVDLLGDAHSDRYQMALDAITVDPNVDGIITILTPQSMTDITYTGIVVSNAKIKGNKPMIASFMGASSTHEADGILQRHNVANMLFPESTAHAMGALYRFYNQPQVGDLKIKTFEGVDKQGVGDILNRCKANGQTYIPEVEAVEILKKYQFPLLNTSYAANKEDIVKLAQTITYPVAMKIVSKDIVHKSDVGGVKLNVMPADLPEAFESMMKIVSGKLPNAILEGVLLVEMAPQNGFEFVLGINKDPALGHMIMFGLGGIYVEVFRDVTFRLLPLTEYDANQMIHEIKSKKFIDGARGAPALDKSAIIECILRLSQLVADFPQIKELDINPLLALPQGAGVKVLDARLVIEK